MSSTITVKVAVVQAASYLFDAQECLTRAIRWIEKASAGGAQLVLLPEAFIPGYPRGLTFGCAVGARTESGRRLWQQYWENAIDIPGPEISELSEAARQCGIFVSAGVVERGPSPGGGTLYCSLVLLDEDGTLLGVHRKLKPTGTERVVWGEGDGSTLHVVDTSIGRIGGLICWENYMPLARVALYQKGVQIYLAPTADSRDSWQSTLRHIACEGRCFVLGCNQVFTMEDLPDNLKSIEELQDEDVVRCRGGSVIISPFGEVLAGPLFNEEGILFAELDMAEIVRGKLDFDVVGHYARPDIFQLTIREGSLDERHESRDGAAAGEDE